MVFGKVVVSRAALVCVVLQFGPSAPHTIGKVLGRVTPARSVASRGVERPPQRASDIHSLGNRQCEYRVVEQLASGVSMSSKPGSTGRSGRASSSRSRRNRCARPSK